MNHMKNLLSLLDPETYDLNRTAVVFGGIVLSGLIFAGMKILAVLHAAGLPS